MFITHPFAGKLVCPLFRVCACASPGHRVVDRGPAERLLFAVLVDTENVIQILKSSATALLSNSGPNPDPDNPNSDNPNPSLNPTLT